MNFIQRIFCKHDDEAHGWSYVKCKKCKSVRYRPKKSGILMNKHLNDLVSRGIYTEQELFSIRMRSGI